MVITKPVRVALGGQIIEVGELCLMDGKIEGLDFFTTAVPVLEVGAADNHHLDAIIGALTMEQWAIRINPENNSLDLERLKRRELIEY
jgi:hypothetical protein